MMLTQSPQITWRISRQVSLALLFAMAIQTASALIWAGRAGARLEGLEAQVASQHLVAERLARLEEQARQARESLARIERKLEAR